MDFKEALPLFFERSTAMQTYWRFYVTIVLALIAFFGSGTRAVLVTALMTVIFILVAVVTLRALLDVTRERVALKAFLASSLSQKSAPERDALSTITKPLTLYSECKVICIHVIGDVFTVAAMWALTAMRGCS